MHYENPTSICLSYLSASFLAEPCCTVVFLVLSSLVLSCLLHYYETCQEFRASCTSFHAAPSPSPHLHLILSLVPALLSILAGSTFVLVSKESVTCQICYDSTDSEIFLTSASKGDIAEHCWLAGGELWLLCFPPGIFWITKISFHQHHTTTPTGFLVRRYEVRSPKNGQEKERMTRRSGYAFILYFYFYFLLTLTLNLSSSPNPFPDHGPLL